MFFLTKGKNTNNFKYIIKQIYRLCKLNIYTQKLFNKRSWANIKYKEQTTNPETILNKYQM